MPVQVLDKAKRRLRALIAFYETHYSTKGIDDLEELILAKLAQLGQHPTIGGFEPSLPTLIKGRRYRRLIVNRRIKIIYYVDVDTVIVTDFFDMRQDPGRMQR